jgi:hypothetical protein
MNPESENPKPTAESVPEIEEESSIRIPEGFYNPEQERIPVPRTEASRSLTKLVGLLMPGTVSTENIDSRHQADVVTTDFQEALVPTAGRHKDEFLKAVGPLLTSLETIGVGNYLSNNYLKNMEAFTANDEDEIVFEGLYTPWQYRQDGAVIPVIDLKKMWTVIVKLPERTEAEQEIKKLAAFYADIVEQAMHNETLQPKATFAERLDEPNLEHLDKLRETLDLFSDEMIAQVAAITEERVATESANRSYMKSAIAPLAVLIRSLRKNTRIGADLSRSLYPEFWQLVDKYHQINCAIGIVNKVRNDCRHDLSYPTV